MIEARSIRSLLLAVTLVVGTGSAAVAQDPEKLPDLPAAPKRTRSKKVPDLPTAPPSAPRSALPDDPLPPLPGDELPQMDALPPLPEADIVGKKLCIWAFNQPFASKTQAPIRVHKVFLEVAKKSPLLRDAILTPTPPKLCTDLDEPGCFIKLGSAFSCETVLVGAASSQANGLVLHTRWISMEKGEVVSKSDSQVETDDPNHVTAWAEGQACQALRIDCKATLSIDADRKDMVLVLDRHLLARKTTGAKPEVLAVRPGLHRLRVSVGDRTSVEKRIPVRIDQTKKVFARQTSGGGLFLFEPSELQGAGAPPASQELKTAKWQTTLGLALAGAGVLAGGFATYEAVHGKSLVNNANDAYRARGAYNQADVGNINSGNSSIKTGNALFIVGGALLAAGAVFTLAF